MFHNRTLNEEAFTKDAIRVPKSGQSGPFWGIGMLIE